MKQRDLLNLFYKKGWWVAREGGSHIVLTNGTQVESIPRHREVNEKLAKALVKRRGLK